MLTYMKDNILTSSGQSIILTKEQEEICKVIYRKTENGYVLCGLYNPEIPDKDYPDGLTAFSVRSSFNGYAQLAGGTSVFNVNGSSDDRFIIGGDTSSDSWIKIWEDNITAYDAWLDRTAPLPNNQKHNHHTRQSYVNAMFGRKDTALVGGHICTSKAEQNPVEGGRCLLLPIYKYLNSMRESVQMSVIPGGAVALRLVNFLR